MNYDYIKYLFNLPPEEIINWYKSKGYTISWDWQDTWQEAHARAFTVAKVMKLDILQEIKTEVDKIFTDGITYREFYSKLQPILKRLGWWGKVKAGDVPGFDPLKQPDVDPNRIVQLGSPYRLKTIYQTNANVAFNSGSYKNQLANAVNRPYWQYKQIPRESARKDHAYYADKVFRYDDPIWDIIYPPNAFNCGCYVNALTLEEVENRGLKVYKGKDVLIKVAEGWNYNPGKTAFKPDLTKYDSELVEQYLLTI